MAEVGARAAVPTSAGPILRAATERLRAAGSPSPRLDAELLVAHALGRDRTWLAAHMEAALLPDALTNLERWLERRATGEPIAYIRGWKEWLSLRVATDARALIPRPETELLAQAAIEAIAERLTRDDRPLLAWEVGTGSGAIALALARRFRVALGLGRVRLVASDASPDALELAGENLAAHGVAPLVTLACGDLLEAAGDSLPRPDVVVANLPYVATAEVETGAGSFGHEPRVALDGGPDGLDVVRRLTDQLSTRGAEGGVALLEIGPGQAEAVIAMAPHGASVLTEMDLSGVERLVRFDLP